jgi:hypothetical protein
MSDLSRVERDQIIAARMARNARIDALKPDRSRFEAMPMLLLPVEAQDPEARYRALRQDVTISQKLAAYDVLRQCPVIRLKAVK